MNEINQLPHLPDPPDKPPLPQRIWLNTEESGGYLGMSGRQFKRIADKYGLEPYVPSPQCVLWLVTEIDEMVKQTKRKTEPS